MLKQLYCVAAVVVANAAVLQAQTVQISLTSPQSGNAVTPGTPIHWSIHYAVSADDNAGLALLLVDLVQFEQNPEKFDLPPADGVPSAMDAFSRPAGISNPGETDPLTGYVGVLRGATGERNLVQIGGAQNTTGEALPTGTGVAESAEVQAGVGQDGPVLLAAGSFVAPATPGNYVFQLDNPIANVLTLANPAPQHSPVVSAGVQLVTASIAFTVADVPCQSCDVNCDGMMDGLDVQAFVDAMLISAPLCAPCAGDTNGDSQLTTADIPAFVACQLGS